MFTGIVETTGKVRRFERSPQAQSAQLVLATTLEGLQLGESVAVNGVCLTVAELHGLNGAELHCVSSQTATFFVSSETLQRSNLGVLSEGSIVNLERALLPTARLSGHLVQGHVDGLARVIGIAPVGDGTAPVGDKITPAGDRTAPLSDQAAPTDESQSVEMEFELTARLGRYCVEKGSVTLDGVSLTINALEDVADSTRIRVMLIPFTWNHTRLSTLQPGDLVNVEVDVLAKYVERLYDRRGACS